MNKTKRTVSSRSRTALSLAVLLPLCISAQSLFAAPPATTIVNSNTSVDLAGATSDGNGGGGYFVQSNSLTISNGTLINYSATGGNGSGGGAGLGGAVFVNSGATLTINNVSFVGNSVTGGAGGVGTTGGTLNGLFTGSTAPAGTDGYTPVLNDFVDINGTTGTKGANGGTGALSFGGAGGNGGAGSNGGNTSTSLELGVASAALDLAGVILEMGSAFANPFTINVGVGLAISTTSAALNLANAALSLDNFNKALAEGQIGLGGTGGNGGTGGQGAVFFGGGLGGNGGDGGNGGSTKSGAPYSGGAAGGDAGSGGSGGLGGFGAGGGKGGDGGVGGDGAGAASYPARAAVPEETGTKNVPETYKTQYVDPNTGATVVVGTGFTVKPENTTTPIVLTSGVNAGTTVNVTVTAVVDQPAGTQTYVIKPAVPAIPAGTSAGRPSGFDGSGGAGGAGGFGGGAGASGVTPNFGYAGGNGGNGYGGAIFVRSGGSLTITGNVTFDQNAANGGEGQAGDELAQISDGAPGSAAGTDLFIMKGSTILLAPGLGKSIVFNGSIADDSAASGVTSSIPDGSGAGLTVQNGLVVFNGANTYSGQTKILGGGVLQAVDGTGLYFNSNLNLAGGVLQSNGSFTRVLGTGSPRVQFTDNGGFAAAGGDLTVRLNNGAALTWGTTGSFIGNGFSLLFGSTSADSNVDFKNAINLGGSARTILNTASLVDDGAGGTVDNKVTLSGVLSNGSVTFGSSSATGSVYLTAVNTYSGGTTVAGGSLVLSGSGTLNSTGTMNVASGADFDISLAGNEAIGDLSGAGKVYLGNNTLTINQSGSTTFSGEIADGGVGGGTEGDLIKQGGGTLTLSGTNTYTGDTDIKAGTLVLSGQLASPKVTVFSGATLTNSSGGLSSNASLTNNGLINQNASDTVASLVNTGTINGSGTLTAATYALNSTSIINANLGNGTVTANGTVALNGTSAAETFNVVAGTTTLGSAERLLNTTALDISSGATLILGGDEKIGSLTGAGSLRNNGGRLSLDSGDFSGVVSEGGGLTKLSSGNLTLSGANTYSGSTLVNNGKLILSGSLTSNVVTVSGCATLDVTNAGLASDTTLTSNGVTTFTADETIDTLNGSGFVALTDTELTLNQGTFSGVISDTGGNGTLSKVSGGTLTLSGNNTYTGDTNLDGGTLTLTGTLESLYVHVSGGTILNDVNGGLASGSTLRNDGTVVLSASDTITALINTGTINGQPHTLTAATYALNSTSIINANLGNGTVTANGTVALNGTSAAENFNVVAGTTTLGSAERLLDTTALDISSGATLVLGGAEKIGILTGAGSLRNNGSRLTVDSGDFSGVISEGGGLTKVSSGNLTLSGANTYSGSTLVDVGTLILTGSLASNVVTVASGAALDVTNAGLASDTTLTSDGNTTFTADETIDTLLGSGLVALTDTELTLNQGDFSGVISDTGGNGTLTKVSGGTLTLSGNNTYTGDTNLDGGTLTLTGKLESLYVHVSGGTTLNDVNGGLASGSTLENDGLVVLSSDDTITKLINTGTINAQPYTLTAATYALNEGSIINANLGTGTVTANGTVALNGTSAAETFNVVAGTTTLGSPERLLDTVAVDIASGATLRLGGVSGAEKIGSLTGAGLLHTKSNRLSLDFGDFSGVIRGSGGVTKLSSGNLTLSGENIYTGSTLIEAGKLILTGSLTSNVVTVSSCATLDVTNAGLASDTALSNNGTINLSIDETVATYTSTGTINGPGKLNAGTYNLNNGSVVNANLGAGNLTVSGTVDLFGTSDSLNVNVTNGSLLNLQGEQRLNAGATVTVDGTLALAGGNQTVNVLQGSGTVDMKQNRFTVTGTGLAFTGNYLGANTTIVADGGTIDLSGGNITSNSTTSTGNGTININDSGLVITKTTDITGNSTVTVGGNSTLESSVSITIAGGSKLEIVDAGSSVTTATLTVNGVLYVIDSSSLDYDTLLGNGTIDSDGSIFVNVNGSVVKGFLKFTDDFTNQGTFAPGASPGLITIAGNYTEAGTLQAELQTTTPVTGHDQIQVGGTVTLQPGSTLVVQTFGGVQPVQGSVYQVIANSVGGPIAASGAFGAVTFDADGNAGIGAPVVNAAAVFDQATGQVITTGLNATGSTFADLGANANQSAAAAALFNTATGLVGPNQINTTTNSGFLARQFLVANGGSATNLARFTPEYFGALSDYAFSSDYAVTNLLLDRVSTLAALPGTKPEGIALYAGMISNNADTADQADLNRTDLYAGGDYAVTEDLTLGLLVTKNEGDISSTFGKSDADGMGVRAYFKEAISKEFLLVGSLGYEKNSYDTRRTTTDVVRATGSTDGTAYSGMLGVNYLAWTKDELSLVPRAAITYSHASIDGFTERGANDRLDLGSYDATRVTGDLGASLVWSTMLDGRAFSVELNLGLEQKLVDDQGDQTATVVTSPATSFKQSFADDEATNIAYGVNVGYNIYGNASIYAGYQGRASTDASSNVNAGLRVSF